MAEKAASNKKIHAVLVPYPLQGHVVPFVHLALKLASSGFTITFVNTQSVHHQITNSKSDSGEDMFAGARKSGLDISYATVSDGFPLDFDRSLNHDEFFGSIMEDFPSRVDELVGTLPAVDCLVADTFYVFGSRIGEKYKAVNVSFWTEPALVFTMYYHMDLLRENGHYGNFDKRECDDSITYIPGVDKINPTDLPSYLQNLPTAIDHRILHKAFADVKKADIVICNTVQEFEHTTISALQQSQPFYAIGPLFTATDTAAAVPTSLWSESDCAKWLDGKPPNSVLYVSFGSYAHASKADITEIAHGLVLSKVHFIWILRDDIVSSDEPDILPEGFLEAIGNRGLIVPWCSQMAVLSHPAVGGFLTHCGWNSILESIWWGVPMVCFPLLTDQFTNRKLVVDDWKIGMNLRDEEGSVRRSQVAEKIECLMGGNESSASVREEIGKVRKTLGSAVVAGGSSCKNFDEFVRDILEKVVGKQPLLL